MRVAFHHRKRLVPEHVRNFQLRRTLRREH
jgi:hypothetical protein